MKVSTEIESDSVYVAIIEVRLYREIARARARVCVCSDIV